MSSPRATSGISVADSEAGAVAVTWHPPPTRPRLVQGGCRLWSARLDDFAGLSWRLKDGLSGDERARADRYRFDGPRMRFVVARAVLRWILGSYVRDAPHNLSIATSEGGKPYLADPSHSWLQFSLAHSCDLVLCLVSRGHGVGVDVEASRGLDAPSFLADLLIAPDQADAITQLPTVASDLVLLASWTMVEAVAKTAGVSVAHVLGDYRPALSPATGQPLPRQRYVGVLGADADAVADADTVAYAVTALRLPDGYVGAMAMAMPADEAWPECPALGYRVRAQDVAAGKRAVAASRPLAATTMGR